MRSDGSEVAMVASVEYGDRDATKYIEDFIAEVHAENLLKIGESIRLVKYRVLKTEEISAI